MIQKIKTNSSGYGYKYSDLSAVNEYVASIGETYYQYTETTEAGVDYIHTVREKDGKEKDIRGCRVIEANPNGKTNPAQAQGSGLTYARRYSLYMAYGLATEDDDGASLDDAPAKITERNVTPKSRVNFKDLREQVYRITKRDELKDLYASVSAMGLTDRQTAVVDEIFSNREACLSEEEKWTEV